jgi:hypothetical protein
MKDLQPVIMYFLLSSEKTALSSEVLIAPGSCNRIGHTIENVHRSQLVCA